MKRKAKRLGRLAEQSAEEIFARRAERFQSHCGWCGESIGEDEPVFAIGGKATSGLDLSPVQGKIIEIALETSEKRILAGVSTFDSDAKKEGNDLVFMVCSELCGLQLKTAVESDLARGRG